MAKVIWTKKAFGQLERAIKYIREEHGVSYSETALNKILQTTELLEKSPNLLVWSYKIIYRTTQDKVVISRVFHPSRNPERLKGI